MSLLSFADLLEHEDTDIRLGADTVVDWSTAPLDTSETDQSQLMDLDQYIYTPNTNTATTTTLVVSEAIWPDTEIDSLGAEPALTGPELDNFLRDSYSHCNLSPKITDVCPTPTPVLVTDLVPQARVPDTNKTSNSRPQRTGNPKPLKEIKQRSATISAITTRPPPAWKVGPCIKTFRCGTPQKRRLKSDEKKQRVIMLEVGACIPCRLSKTKLLLNNAIRPLDVMRRYAWQELGISSTNYTDLGLRIEFEELLDDLMQRGLKAPLPQFTPQGGTEQYSLDSRDAWTMHWDELPHVLSPMNKPYLQK
ncbi:hypothetical protein TWF730_007023 [Orbilia blumenaviensis]|uniref:Uncharacterized protein n=1 Tax=Orbilia blumenaviensis TaxID=1796055 RepID=A0AAV9VGH9_9PEZI